MSDPASETPGLLTLFGTSSTTTINLSNKVPQQIIYLVGYRVEMTDATAALANPILYIDLPWLSGGSQMIDQISGRSLLPIMLDNAKVTNWQGLNKPVYIKEDIQNNFDMNVRDSNGALVSIVHICLQFRLTHTNLS